MALLSMDVKLIYVFDALYVILLPGLLLKVISYIENRIILGIDYIDYNRNTDLLIDRQ